MTELQSVCVKGYAKINLHLDVIGRMENGYHQVETVMQSVSLYDGIELTPKEEEGITLSCDVFGVPLDERNLAVRAAMLFFEKTGHSPRLHIDIQKRIPMAAGMAGGSTDGAAVLLGLNRMYGNPLSEEELLALGGRLGADVPFCIFGGTALAKGKGDEFLPFPTAPSCYFVIACEGEGVSTPWAYGLLDALYDNFEGACTPHGTDRLRCAVEEGALSSVAQEIYNIFEAPVLAERPVAKEIRDLLLQAGALGAMMSGSGPSVFGVFANEAAAETAIAALTARGYRAYGCQPVSKRSMLV